jgi:hypothetical protein
MAQLFKETKERAEEKIALADLLAERIDEVCGNGRAIRFTDQEWELVTEALEVFAEQEHKRVRSMEEGLKSLVLGEEEAP